MVFDWKTVKNDEILLNQLYANILKEMGKPIKIEKYYELQLNKWLKIELQGMYLGDTFIFGVIRKVHKKYNFPPEWFKYPKENEDRIYSEKITNYLNKLFKEGALEASMRTIDEIMNSEAINYFIETLNKLLAILNAKENNYMRITVFEPTLRTDTVIEIQHFKDELTVDEKSIPVETIFITSYLPLLPLSWILGVPFMTKKFIPIVWVMQYPVYTGQLVLLRIPEDDLDYIKDIISQILILALAVNKERIVRDQVRLFPVEPLVFKHILHPPAQFQFYITDRGIFFEKPMIPIEWYIRLTFNLSRYNEAFLYNMGARDYSSIIAPMLLHL